MKTIKEDIKAGTFRKAYLLYGTEKYLRGLYKNKLKDGVLAGGDEINFSVFAGKGIDETEVIHTAQTMPFFAERRLILIEDSGWFKGQGGSKMAEVLHELPDTAVFVFVEDEVDKRGRMYKTVKELGHICEFEAMEEKDLKLWVASLLRSEQKKITDATASYLLEKTGTSMENIRTEIEKLIGYTYGRDIVTKEDIDAVCTEQINGKVFQMVDSAAAGQTKRALMLYRDLLTLREKPMSILFLLIRHLNILVQVQSLAAGGMQGAAIAKKVGFPPFAAAKYLSQTRAFSEKELCEAIEYGALLEEKIKTGWMDEQVGMELMIVKLLRADKTVS